MKIDLFEVRDFINASEIELRGEGRIENGLKAWEIKKTIAKTTNVLVEVSIKLNATKGITFAGYVVIFHARIFILIPEGYNN